MCDGNNTCNSTDLLNATESELSPKNLSEKFSIVRNFIATEQFCTCDLQLHICDINCCCDPDCSTSDKFIFQYCNEEPRYYDTRQCSYTKQLYINNTPFEWEINQNSLFCVAKSNLPPYYIVQRRQPLLSYNATVQLRIGKFSWVDNEIEQPKQNAKFQYGNNIWIIDKGRIKKFSIPDSFHSHRCITQKDIIALKDFKVQCSQTDISEKNLQLNMKNYFQNMFVLNVTSLSNQSEIGAHQQKCSKWSCLPINPYICDDNFQNCDNISHSDPILNTKCFLNSAGNIKICMNILKKLQYNFYHNLGISKVDVLFVLSNFSYSFNSDKDFEFVQEFYVNFLWNGQKKNFTEILSGNPGYFIGKPILFGILRNVGNKSHTQWRIQRSAINFKESYLTIPGNQNGESLTDDNYLSIEFGYNFLSKFIWSTTYEVDKKLLMELSTNVSLKNAGNTTKKVGKANEKIILNGTFLCQGIQKNILELWGYDEKQKIGMFGNAKQNNTEEWIPILYKDKKDVILKKTIGYLVQKDGTLQCSQLIYKLKISIFYARIDIHTLINQNKILGVTYEFKMKPNSTLLYKNGIAFTKSHFENEVVFYDVTFPKKKKIVEPPTLNIKLPYDFFYPFVKVDNGATNYVNRLFGVVFTVLPFIIR